LRALVAGREWIKASLLLLGALFARYARVGAVRADVAYRPAKGRRLGIDPAAPCAGNTDRLELIMDIDTDRIDEAVLALLYLGLHGNGRTWKGFDWDAMNRLHEKGMISNPVGKAKSVVLTEDGEREAERLFYRLFGK
jgi:hypothetical protein